MMDIPITEAMVCWTPETGRVLVVSHPDTVRASRGYARAVGACFTNWRKHPPALRLALLFIEFNTMVVRDAVPPEAAHKALLVIPEYRRAIAPDTPGAET